MTDKDDNWPTLPIVKNIGAKSMSDQIVPMTAEQTRSYMKELFDNFEKMTGYKPVIVGNMMPTGVLIPDENKK